MKKVIIIIVMMITIGATAQKGHSFKNPKNEGGVAVAVPLPKFKAKWIGLIKAVDITKINFDFNVRATPNYTYTTLKRDLKVHLANLYGKEFTDEEAIALVERTTFQTPSPDDSLQNEIARIMDDGSLLWRPRAPRLDLDEKNAVADGVVWCSNLCLNFKQPRAIEEDQSTYIENPKLLTNKKEETGSVSKKISVESGNGKLGISIDIKNENINTNGNNTQPNYAQNGFFNQTPQAYTSVIPTNVVVPVCNTGFSTGFASTPIILAPRTNAWDAAVAFFNGAAQVGTAAVLKNNYSNTYYTQQQNGQPYHGATNTSTNTTDTRGPRHGSTGQ